MSPPTTTRRVLSHASRWEPPSTPTRPSSRCCSRTVSGGLQVIVEDENLQPVWVDVPAVAGALIVNVGDFLQLMSNDRFKSVEHRVVAKSVGPRVSVACFFQSHGTAASTRVYSPIIPKGDPSPQLYRSTTVKEMLQHFMEKGLDGTSALQHFRV
ncbi:hypothetical protein QYE76_000692 [Lolium multiflorum]|uniref:Fe2OG dioxygenase domain-containing protein n=1 Tax=Lolium multiflorum TaxID=4521 RepID=A0AAD8RKM6_LOLMU|nr:hypothetical protein QYE76_000692 [Lolium multiflorum]